MGPNPIADLVGAGIAISIMGILALAVICAFFCAAVASRKGYSWFLWLIGGGLFGPIALIAAAGLPDLYLRKLMPHERPDLKNGPPPLP